MHRMELIDALELYQHCILDYEIGTKAEFELLSFVNHRECHLPANGQSAECELEAQTFLICGFEQARPQRA